MFHDTAPLPKLPCRQCGNTEVSILGALPPGEIFAGSKLDPPWPGGLLARCSRCHLVYRTPTRSEAEYEALYVQAPDNVWTSQRVRGDRNPLKRLLDAHALGPTDILEIGCYDGAFLATLDARFHKFGVELSRAAAAVARSRGVDIVADGIRNLASTTRQFDVVLAVDVIEHILDPASFLRQML